MASPVPTGILWRNGIRDLERLPLSEAIRKSLRRDVAALRDRTNFTGAADSAFVIEPSGILLKAYDDAALRSGAENWVTGSERRMAAVSNPEM
jgi:hypothetical protein